MNVHSGLPSNADSVAGFDRTIPLAVEALERRARLMWEASSENG